MLHWIPDVSWPQIGTAVNVTLFVNNSLLASPGLKNVWSASTEFQTLFPTLRPSDAFMHLTIIGSDNGLAPGWRQTIIWTNDGILSIGPLGTNFSEILIGIQTFSFKKMHLKMASAKWRPFCLSLNVLTPFENGASIHGYLINSWTNDDQNLWVNPWDLLVSVSSSNEWL